LLPLVVAFAVRFILALTFCTACIPNGIDAIVCSTTGDRKKGKQETKIKFCSQYRLLNIFYEIQKQ
jgi:hypothetical protein